ncbi:MAG: hypothetical protein GY866_38860 [Proteobacteria bacterium]|nr:hypothetical protein [Pseudomonadota bacterium]
MPSCFCTIPKKGFGDKYEKIKANVERKIPLGKVSRPEDVADAILSLMVGSELVTR